jgi:hypothetical protein
MATRHFGVAVPESCRNRAATPPAGAGMKAFETARDGDG